LLELAEQEPGRAGCDGFSLFMRKRLAGAGSLVTRETTPEEEMATPTLSRQMLEIHPWAGEVDLDALADCIAACYECAQTCMGCADACLSEVEIDPLRKCIRINLDCADICDVTGRVLTRQTEYDAPTTKAQLAACREACATCAEECERHAENHDHCRICAEACRHCEQACANLLESAMK
jgi:hypothetical protein